MNQLSATPYLSILQERNELLKEQNNLLREGLSINVVPGKPSSSTTPGHENPSPQEEIQPLFVHIQRFWSCCLALWQLLTVFDHGEREGRRDVSQWKEEYLQASEKTMDALRTVESDLQEYIHSEPFDRLLHLLSDHVGLDSVKDESSWLHYAEKRRLSFEGLVNNVLSQQLGKFMLRTLSS